MKLYDIGQKFSQIWNMVGDEEADLEMLENCLISMECELEEKAESMVRILKNIEADTKALKEEEDRLSKRRKSLENKHDSIKRWLESNLIQMGIDKVKTSIASVSIANNPPSVEVLNETLIPDVYKISQPDKIDKKGILEALKAGANIPGAMIQQTKGIRIR